VVDVIFSYNGLMAHRGYSQAQWTRLQPNFAQGYGPEVLNVIFALVAKSAVYDFLVLVSSFIT